MRSYLPAVAVLLALAGPALAQPKDPAELFPAQTLAYLEVRQPDKLTRELASLIKGSSLEDLAAVLAKARTERGDTQDGIYFGNFIFGELGMLFSPEALAEFGRMGGGAVGITGWTKDEGPEVVGVLYYGQSNLFPMYLRAYLAADSEIRIAGKVEGVNLYRARGRDYYIGSSGGPGGAPPAQPPIKDKGPTFALLPGMAIIASTPKAAGDAVRRAKKKVSEPALSSTTTFKKDTLREKANVFAYADVAALTTQADAAAAGKRNRDWDSLKAVFNPRGMGTAVAALSLQNGNLNFRAQVQVDPKQPSPLFDLLPDKKAALDGLHFAPKDGLLTLTMPWPDGAKRWGQVLAFADALARAEGAPADQLPSKMIADAEQKAGLNLGNDLFAKVAGFTLTVDPHGERAKSAMPMQRTVTATDADAAKALDELVPKVLALGGRGPAGAPTAEKVNGVTVRNIPGENLPWREALYFGREGKTLVLGPTKEEVAAALAGGAKNGGLLGEAKAAAVLKDTGDAQVVGAWSLPEAVIAWMKLVTVTKSANTATKPPLGGAPPGGIPQAAPPKEKAGSAEEKLVKEMRQVVAPLAPAVVTLTRKDGLVVLETKQAGLKTVSARAINVMIDEAVRQLMSRRGGGINSSAPIVEPSKP
jgi:hypothetical protein